MVLPSISPEVRDWMQLGTAVVAVVAFIHTFYRAHKDRAHLRARSVIWGSQDDPDDPSLSLEAKVVNPSRVFDLPPAPERIHEPDVHRF